MGIAKRMWEEEQDRGYSSNEGKTVCSNCFGEYALKQFIEEHHTHFNCSYCEAEGEDIIACELDSLIDHILTSIRYEWGHPADEGLPYETREGGWQVATVYDTWELLDEIGLGNQCGQIYEDICSSIHNQEWCERDPYSLSMDRTLIFGWEKFSDFVKNKARYVFFKAKNPDYDEEQHDEMDPVRILDALENIIKQTGLVKSVDVNTQIRRVRIIDPEENLTTAKELGSPPSESATMANRMSPAGIPMFYGAFDFDTAIKETYEPCLESKKAICGVFEPVRSLSVIDLSDTPYLPSLFDEHARHNRSNLSFLYDFIADFTKPIERNDRVHVDYVPTQIATEYIRHIFKTYEGSEIDGVIYPSSKNKGKKAIVIFATSEQCVDQDSSMMSDSTLRLVNVESRELEGI
ncbi:RES domain protein [Nitrosococcus halophilus Nc 4]|uniref:RES domain protein n=1 Tax=Nitrosococcus halophilus (strain Nc4) TaxID=472759 RepID=D5BUP2_NITHN|nr:HEPN-associated N-terminal domain-containing protein [Nitrosococcus halophilus]ADE13442.1 RES domain protein [Nitrosococcus halophilus Nc 4]